MTRISTFSPLARAIALGTRPGDLLPELHRELLVALGSSRSVVLQRTGSAGTYVATSGRGFPELGHAIAGAEAAALDRMGANGPHLVPLDDVPAIGERLAAARALVVPIAPADRPSLLLVADPAADPAAATEIAAHAAVEFAVAMEWARLAHDRALHGRVQELSLIFSRGISSMAGLASAFETLTLEANMAFGTLRIAIWLHDRRNRELALLAASSAAPGEITRVPSDDPMHPAARGLRLERPRFVDAAGTRALIAPLRGWRRALGTLSVDVPVPAELEDGQLLGAVHELARALGVAIENVQLLEEVLRQRRLLEDTFNSFVDLVVVTDNALRVVQMNEAFVTRIGRTRHELFEHDLRDILDDEMGTWAAGDRQAGTAVRTRTFESARLGGTMAVTLTPLINEDGEPAGRVLVARDITVQVRLEAEREALRARLAQSEKLASLGQFVAGIAHEMNNPLQGVLGHLELMMSTNEEARGVRSELRRIYQEADRAAKIVRNLLVFTGSRRMTRRRLRVDRVLSRALSSRRAALARGGIEIIRRQDENVAPVTGDPLLLQQAFLNVLINAEHAIADAGGRGTIEVSTSRSADGLRTVTTIRDTGAGLSPDVLPRIFDPFFTTKDVGRGTGLGLAITYGIVHEHGGVIQAANAPEGGAVFTIELPASPGEGRE